MTQRIPQDIQELLDQVHDDEKHLEFQQKWNEYIAINTQYERNYPIQLANLVDANLRFKEDKSIPTPAEQMHGFTDRMRDDLNDYIYEKQQEKLYEVEDVPAEQLNDLDRSQELGITWIKEHRQQQQLEQTPEQPVPEKEEDKGSYDFKLLFDNMDFQDAGNELTQERDREMEDLEHERD